MRDLAVQRSRELYLVVSVDMHVDAEHDAPIGNEHPAVAGVFERRRARDTDNPLTVREAARFLGVSPQTVYL